MRLIFPWILFSLVAAPGATAGEVVVVVSAHSGPFYEAAQAFEQAFQHERKTDALVVQAPGRPLANASVVVAMGTESARSLIDVNVPQLHCLTLHPAREAAALMLTYPVEEQLQLIRKVLPRATRLGVVYSDDHSAAIVDQARSLAADYDLELVPVHIGGPTELGRALNGLANRVDVLWGVPDASLYTPATARTVLVFSFRHRVPFIGLSDQWVKAGAALAPSFDYAALGGQCAQIAGELLDGVSVNEIGARKPNFMPYTVNLNSLKQLKLVVAPDVIDEARRVY